MIHAYNMDKPWKYFTKGKKPATKVIYNLYEITRIAKSMREGNSSPLQYSCLETPVDGGAWWAAVHGVAQSQTHCDLACMHELEKEMATHSSILAWRIPVTEEPGGLPSMGLHRVGQD